MSKLTPAEPKITLFDIPSNFPDKRSGSPFTWPVRFALNFKQLPYNTVWATHDQIEATCKANDIQLAPGAPYYTFPCIIDRTDSNDVVRLMDSRVIVEYLERIYPDKPLNPSDERTKQVEHHALTQLAAVVPLLIFGPFMSVAPQGVVAHFERVIPGRFGMTLQELIERGGKVGTPQRDGLWEKVREGFEGFGLKDGDKWLDGEAEPKYKDCIVLAWMMAIYVSGQEDGWPKLMTWDGGKWRRYWEATEEYIVVK